MACPDDRCDMIAVDTPALMAIVLGNTVAEACTANYSKRAVPRAAVRRIRERAEQLKLGRFDWSEWKSYRGEGRP
jgi:hypothetical protein